MRERIVVKKERPSIEIIPKPESWEYLSVLREHKLAMQKLTGIKGAVVGTKLKE